MQRLQKTLTANAAIIAGAILTLLAVAEVPISVPIVVAVMILVTAVVSAVWPRWSEQRGIGVEHPAAVTTAVVALLAAGGDLLGLSISAEQASVLIAGAGGIVGLVTPRQLDR